MESYQEEYKRTYGVMWDAMKPVSSEMQNTLETLCQHNDWLKKNGIAFQDDVSLEGDSPYSFCMLENISMLKLYFEHGNWSIRQGVVYRDLFFCNQVNGGDEWWVCKLDHESNTYVPFESISMDPVIKNGNFESLMDGLLSTIVHADEKATKVEAETKTNNDMGSSIEPIFSRNEAALIIELFEDLLEKFNIKIPSPEDDERAEDNGAPLYGSTYSDLLDEVEKSIINVVERARKQEIPLVKYEFSGDV